MSVSRVLRETGVVLVAGLLIRDHGSRSVVQQRHHWYGRQRGSQRQPDARRRRGRDRHLAQPSGRADRRH